ncbi:MAG: energy transducer TonB [Burkholderiales bacterium]
MTASAAPVRGALWAQPADVEEQTLPLWRALIIAFGVEILVPFLIYGVNWSWLPSLSEPPPEPVMSVRLEQPPPPVEMPPPEEKKKKEETPKPKKKKKLKNQIPIEPPKEMPDELPSKIEVPKVEPEPKPEKKEEEKKPEPEPEAPPLPSVFRDVKPVKKVRPKYPRAAEDAHIQGRVRVRLAVNTEGLVTGVTLLLAEPPGVFDAVVLEAAKQFVFKKDGTAYDADQEFVFRLDE